MDKLTAIKIKYDDGTYSDEIPVSVLSENVEWDNTHTLVDVLGSINVDVTGTIQDQISQLFNEKISATQLQNYVASQLNEDVSTWLNNNVNPVGSAVIVDSSLTISGAAADAKKTGDEISDLKSALDSVVNQQNDIMPPRFDGSLYQRSISLQDYATVFSSNNYIDTSGVLHSNSSNINVYKYVPGKNVLAVKLSYSDSALGVAGAVYKKDGTYSALSDFTGSSPYYLNTDKVGYFLINGQVSNGDIVSGLDTITEVYYAKNDIYNNSFICDSTNIQYKGSYINNSGVVSQSLTYYISKFEIDNSYEYYYNGTAPAYYGACYDSEDTFIGKVDCANGKLIFIAGTEYALINLSTDQYVSKVANKKTYDAVDELSGRVGLRKYVNEIIANEQYTSGKYVNHSTGELSNNSVLAVSDYIDISNVKTINTRFYYNGSAVTESIAFYDSGKVYISGLTGATNDNYTLPSNAVYMRFNIFIAELDSIPSTHYIDDNTVYIPWAYIPDIDDVAVIHGRISEVKNVISKPIDFNNKNLLVFGDSIAYGYASNPLEIITNPWIKQFCTKANATLIQQAVSGSTLATRTGHSDSIYEKINGYSGTTPDVIFIAGGTNDYGNDVPVGTYTDTSTTTVYGAMNNICSILASDFSGIPVYFITPINRSNIVTKSGITYFDSIRNAVYEIATLNGHSVINGAELGFPLKQGQYQNSMIYDNLHPTIIGHKMYANAVSGLLL